MSHKTTVIQKSKWISEKQSKTTPMHMGEKKDDKLREKSVMQQQSVLSFMGDFEVAIPVGVMLKDYLNSDHAPKQKDPLRSFSPDSPVY